MFINTQSTECWQSNGSQEITALLGDKNVCPSKTLHVLLKFSHFLSRSLYLYCIDKSAFPSV